ncbi:MAG: diaminopimelate decarboxylase, partial [Candidatus Methanomethylophilaceae archaeon]|nr:diaminopimelate decarboxylase [Candidatus Methanomethylophilaceae archaeon]
MEDYESDGGRMLFAGMYVSDIAREFGTPVYVTDEQRLRKNYRDVYGAFSKEMDTRIHYACKANSNLAVLRILEQEESGIDAVSIGEVLTCLRAGFTADRIMYTGVNVSDEELEAVSHL